MLIQFISSYIELACSDYQSDPPPSNNNPAVAPPNEPGASCYVYAKYRCPAPAGLLPASQIFRFRAQIDSVATVADRIMLIFVIFD